MKKNINTGERIINYLASCGRQEVEMVDLLRAVVDGYGGEADLATAFNQVLPLLKSLEAEDMVKLSFETIPPGASVPRFIYVQPRMKRAADKCSDGNPAPDMACKKAENRKPKDEKPAVAGAGGRKAGERKEDAVMSRFHVFVDLMEKKRRSVRIPGEWSRLVSAMIYHDIEEEAPFQACVKSFVNGLIWQARREGPIKGGQAAGKEEKEEPQMRPELLGQIEEIVKAAEVKNGELKGNTKPRRHPRGNDSQLTSLDREEIRDYMRCLHHMRDDIQPGRLWQHAVSKFISELLDNLPAYEACRESFRAGIVWQMNRGKLEKQS
jgi:hypothetical protein